MKKLSSLPKLFLGLGFSTLAGAQAGTTLLVKTDMSCNWKLDGQPMGLLKGDDSIVVLVSPGEHVILASTTDGESTIRTKVEVDKVEKTVEIQLKSQSDQQTKAQQAAAVRGPGAAAPTPTWTDPATGLMWASRDNGSDVDWNQADAYCSKLQLAGYKDWRLPTIEELEGIFDPKVNASGLLVDKVTHDVHVRGNLKLTGWHWSSSLGDGPGQPWQWAWLFQFTDARRSEPEFGKPQKNFLTFSWSMRALCVRLAGE
jgi:hypothetical protein